MDSMDYNSENNMLLPLTPMTTEVKLGDNIINSHLSKNVDLSSTLVINGSCSNTNQDKQKKYVNEIKIENNEVAEKEPKNNTIIDLGINPLENRLPQDENIENQEHNAHIPDNASLPEAIAPPSSNTQMEVETLYPQFKTHEIKSLPATSVQISTDITDNPSSDLKRRSDGDEQAKLDSLDMRKYHDRLKTYANWPISFLKPETLANNGFYYLNRGDEVRCAFCKVEVMRWEPGDDPAADHKKWAPQCPFLRERTPGDQSPPVGRDECGVHVPPAATPGPVRLSGPANPRYSTLTARLDSFKDWPLSLRQKPKELADAGFFYTGHGDKTKCFYCDGGLKDWEDNDVPWEQHARWFDRCAFVMLVMGRDYVQRVLADVSLIRATSSAPPAAPLPAPAPPALHTDSEPASTAPELPATTAADDEKLCKICYEQERNVCFVPCGHVVACATCALSTTKCPLCRRTFTNAVRLYYA